MSSFSESVKIRQQGEVKGGRNEFQKKEKKEVNRLAAGIINAYAAGTASNFAGGGGEITSGYNGGNFIDIGKNSKISMPSASESEKMTRNPFLNVTIQNDVTEWTNTMACGVGVGGRRLSETYNTNTEQRSNEIFSGDSVSSKQRYVTSLVKGLFVTLLLYMYVRMYVCMICKLCIF